MILTIHVWSLCDASYTSNLETLVFTINDNEVFARKEEQKEIGQLEHNKLRRLHQLYLIYEENLKLYTSKLILTYRNKL